MKTYCLLRPRWLWCLTVPSLRRYKDSVFVDLFGEDKNAKDNFLVLYNALHGTHLDSSTELKRLRLEQIMYMTFYNDVVRLVDDRIIVLIEHQSTVNANMPLRFLQYVARLYTDDIKTLRCLYRTACTVGTRTHCQRDKYQL